MISSEFNHLPKVPSPNTIKLRVGASTYTFQEHAIQSKALATMDLLVPATPSLLFIYPSPSQKSSPKREAIFESFVSFTLLY